MCEPNSRRKSQSQSSEDAYEEISAMAQFAIENWSEKPEKYLPALAMAYKLNQKCLAEFFLPRAAELSIETIESFRSEIPPEVFGDLAIRKSKCLQAKLVRLNSGHLNG